MALVQPSDHDAVTRAYDAVAAEYARQFVDELDRKPFDRELLDALAVGRRQGTRM